MPDKKKVIIVPCSGVGKPFGTITREAAYQVTEEDRPERTQIVPLSLLVLGDEEARAAEGHGNLLGFCSRPESKSIPELNQMPRFRLVGNLTISAIH